MPKPFIWTMIINKSIIKEIQTVEADERDKMKMRDAKKLCNK